MECNDQFHPPPALHQGKKPRYLMDRIVSGLHSWFVLLSCIVLLSIQKYILECTLLPVQKADPVNTNWQGFKLETLAKSHKKACLNAVWLPFQRGRALLTMYKWQVCYAVQRCAMSCSATCIKFIRKIPHTELSCVFTNKIRHVGAYQQACEGPLTTFAVP